jgi:hypothetical protein
MGLSFTIVKSVRFLYFFRSIIHTAHFRIRSWNGGGEGVELQHTVINMRSLLCTQCDFLQTNINVLTFVHF